MKTKRKVLYWIICFREHRLKVCWTESKYTYSTLLQLLEFHLEVCQDEEVEGGGAEDYQREGERVETQPEAEDVESRLSPEVVLEDWVAHVVVPHYSP